MKALSLLQPWATLVAIGAKKIETRSWNTKYRGPLLIHASKKMDKSQKELCKTQPFLNALKHLEELPLGKIIGSVTLLETSTTDFFKQCSGVIALNKKYSKKAWDIELAFGDYSPNRFGWLLQDSQSFTHHIPINGALSLWDFEERICLKCGCTQNDACFMDEVGPCWWVGENLCSHCKPVANDKKASNYDFNSRNNLETSHY
jgi:activating signal cointegrator 1